MRPLLQHASRSILHNPALLIPPQSSSVPFGIFKSASQPTSICLQCQFRSSLVFLPRDSKGYSPSTIPPSRPARCNFSSSKIVSEKSTRPSDSSPETKPSPQVNEPAPLKPDLTPKGEDTIARVPVEDLPSHREGQRWGLSKRFSEIMDNLLPKLAIVTQKVNTYTGTDYSGIEALRREIKEQEKLVRTRRLAVDESKLALDAAHAQQASSQKEVVGLLERKHSWSATDLERYMSLIRSEHVNDQAVHAAKDNVLAAETALEEARTQLEKRERAQYHEEQIWSDTIRRNSTWVTFGLMGVNIFLLLASLVVLEPWRRRRMVREIRSALDAQKTANWPAGAAQSTAAVETAIDTVVEPAGQTLESTVVPEQPAPVVTEVEIPVEARNPAPYVAVDLTEGFGATLTPEQPKQADSIAVKEEIQTSPVPATWQSKITAAAKDLLSERYISVRKIDFTTAVVQGAAAGAVIAGALLTLIRPN
ncbi:hypothetical protein K469DRAFT_684992 [Zopfia rhizophila CBS 207.26]|uniref:Sensitive to high expression protein 9, mitochondrial n=1 Tax=Zopfia rhizophila CBS 207.26 TaxID=1314779 RepID=A0A6A6E8Y1_9PEZI|nr:hypothetical protein K469DRAFT_684992 [Zopfia rhizophila CBS 207.26]